MHQTFDDLPGWTFEIEEMTPGVWSIIGTGADGHTVSITGGTDPDAMLSDLKERAGRISTPPQN